MKFIIFLLHVAHCYIVTTNIDNYIQKCGGKYVEEISYDISSMVDKINNIIDEFYTKNVIDKLNLVDIVIVENIDNVVGLFCPPSTIVLVKSDEDILQSTIHHEIMHLICYRNGKSFVDEWNVLNKFGYLGEVYENENLRQGFITKYGMKNTEEDISTIFEEFAMRTYSKSSNVYYDKTINAKFKLLFTKLIEFHPDFEGIIKKRNSDENFIYPNIGDDNKSILILKCYIVDIVMKVLYYLI